MCRLCGLIIFITCFNTIYAQTLIVNSLFEPVFSVTNQDRSDYILGDIDSDGIIDSLYYDFKDESIKIKLSSKEFDVLSIDYPIYIGFSLDVMENMLYIYHQGMRSEEYLSYEFDAVKVGYQLVYSSSESDGTTTNDGLGVRNIDFRTGEYTADFMYFDRELDSLISLPPIDLVIPMSPIYLNDTVYSEYISYDIFSYYKKRHMIEERLRNINIKNMLELESFNMPSSIEIETSSIDSLLLRYGKNMGYDHNLKFSYNNLNERDNYDYISSIMPLYTTPKTIVYFITFSFYTPTYFIYYLDRETFDNRYVEYEDEQNLSLSKIILDKLPDNNYPIRDFQYE